MCRGSLEIPMICVCVPFFVFFYPLVFHRGLQMILTMLRASISHQLCVDVSSLMLPNVHSSYRSFEVFQNIPIDGGTMPVWSVVVSAHKG